MMHLDHPVLALPNLSFSRSCAKFEIDSQDFGGGWCLVFGPDLRSLLWGFSFLMATKSPHFKLQWRCLRSFWGCVPRSNIYNLFLLNFRATILLNAHQSKVNSTWSLWHAMYTVDSPQPKRKRKKESHYVNHGLIQIIFPFYWLPLFELKSEETVNYYHQTSGYF